MGHNAYSTGKYVQKFRISTVASIFTTKEELLCLFCNSENGRNPKRKVTTFFLFLSPENGRIYFSTKIAKYVLIDVESRPSSREISFLCSFSLPITTVQEVTG